MKFCIINLINLSKTKVLSDIYGVELKSIELDSSGNETAEIIKKIITEKPTGI